LVIGVKTPQEAVTKVIIKAKEYIQKYG